MNETFAPFFEAAHTIMSDTHVITLLAVAVTVAATLGALIRKLLLENGTEKKAVEQVARLETAITQLIDAEKFGHVGSFAWNFDDPTLSFWSEEMYRLFGIRARSSTPAVDSLVAYVHTDDRVRATEEWNKASTSNGDFLVVFRIVPATGETRYLRVQGHTVLHADMSPRSIRGAALDATKEMEVDRAKTEFASLASHQLKTPLSAISWLSEGLLSPKADPLSDKQRTFITSIHQESHQMTAIVNELLNVSRIELGTFGVALEEVDVCEMATSVVQEQQHTADAKHISVTLICAPDVPHLNADKSLVRMVIQNLISNAIKYTPDEGKVTCEITYENIGHEIVIVRVSDTGIGIPRDQRDNVFKKLYRAPNAKAYAPDGTGLGLYVVKNVVDRAGGTITFDSREGSGTAFNVSLPRYWGKGSGAQIPTAQMQAPEKDAILSRIWKHLRRKQS